jgi:hypothetical protein
MATERELLDSIIHYTQLRNTESQVGKAERTAEIDALAKSTIGILTSIIDSRVAAAIKKINDESNRSLRGM